MIARLLCIELTNNDAELKPIGPAGANTNFCVSTETAEQDPSLHLCLEACEALHQELS